MKRVVRTFQDEFLVQNVRDRLFKMVLTRLVNGPPLADTPTPIRTLRLRPTLRQELRLSGRPFDLETSHRRKAEFLDRFGSIVSIRIARKRSLWNGCYRDGMNGSLGRRRPVIRQLRL